MSYIYMVQMDIPAQHEADFNRIYDTEHVPMLSKVPGVSKVTRYRLEKSNDSRMQKYLAIYEIESPSVVDKRMGRGRRLGRLGNQDPPALHQPPPQLLQEALEALSDRGLIAESTAPSGSLRSPPPPLAGGNPKLLLPRKRGRGTMRSMVQGALPRVLELQRIWL